MESFEVYNKYLNAKKRFNEELNAIQKAYISSHYTFKEGDIVKIKNIHYNTPTLIVIDAIYFNNNGNYADEESYRNPVVKVSGHMVDEEGYDKTYFSNSTQTVGVGCYAKDVIEVTYIRHKGLRGR